MSGSDVYVKNQLFATLDTTIRKVKLDNFHKILLSDTVGFIRKLPHNLVASFRSTLKEVLEADLHSNRFRYFKSSDNGSFGDYSKSSRGTGC